MSRSWRNAPLGIAMVVALSASASGQTQPAEGKADSKAESSAEAQAKPAGEAQRTEAGNAAKQPAPTPTATKAAQAAAKKPRKRARTSPAKPPPLPKPTPAQLRAFEELRKEADAYAASAKDYRSTLTMIVKHHYEERRRRVLSALDKEIGAEQETLEKARLDAIARLEAFIERYSGPNADPEATPDAMYRLAALYEERARIAGELEQGLKPAIALYRRIIREFPKYKEIAGVHYYLGHAYMDSAELEQAQQAWRSLVCSNNFRVDDSKRNPDKIRLQAMDQDHDEAFWNAWYNKNPIPFDQLPDHDRDDYEKFLGETREELRYRDPYAKCEPLPQDLTPGEEPRYVAEVWWQLGNHHFEGLDMGAGPYALNRAMSAYEHSMKYERPPLYGVAMYKRAWTYFKQQRYKTGVDWFVNLLHYADEQEEKTGDPGADFRAEAYTYIAGSLTYVDFEGPPGDDPQIPRSDVLDLESDPLVAEDKMRIALERVQDPALVPQDKKWTVEIYKALALEFSEINQHRNAIIALERTLEKFPMDRDAPKMKNKVAELYDELAKLAPEGSAVKDEYAGKALKARTELATYVGNTPWTQTNRDDPEAITQAEQIVKAGLQRAAADHTNYARAYFAKASQLTDEEEQRVWIRKAVAEYRLAATGWSAYIEQDPTGLDVYESRFWLADARYWIVVLQVALGQTPPEDDVAIARETAEEVRDSNEDNKFLQPAAYYVVTLADKIVEDRYREFETSGGSGGFQKLEKVTFAGEGEARKPMRLQVPDEIAMAIQARDEYNARIPLDQDPQNNGLLYAFQAADYYFVYGQFDQARKRYEPLMFEYCGKNKWGYQAWEKLISMSNFEGDVERSRTLAEGKSCAFNEETKAQEAAIRTPVKQGVAYLDARKLYEEAEKMPEGPERQKKWRQAAAAYKVALDAAPERDEAPEAAMNGAYAYKQVGEYDRAIEMYRLFIERYGNEDKLSDLRTGNPKAEPPVEANPEKFEERVKFLKLAYDALGNAYVLFFDYPKAAETFDTISMNQHFAQEQRREASEQALNLYASLADTKGMSRARDVFFKLGATPEQRAEADFVVASAELKRWDQFSPNEGANALARKRAEFAMRNYHTANDKNNAAAKFVVDAAYWVAKMKRSAGDIRANNWWKTTMQAYDQYVKVAPKKEDGTSEAAGTPQASRAAEADYILLDAEISQKFDYDSGHHRFKGTPVEVLNAYQEAAKEAKTWYDKLERIVSYYASPEWATAAIARQGTLYDSLRTGLYNTRPPELQMFDKKTEALLLKAEQSDNLQLQERADQIRMQVEGAWRDKRDSELNSADTVMVNRYVNSVILARRYNVSNPAVVRAIQRLAFFTDVLTEPKMAQYAAQVEELKYTEGMFLRVRPGLVTAPPASAMPPSAPSAP